MSKKVSLLIPARNEEKVLDRLLQSIEKLELYNFDLEVLLCNDDSKDSTGKIMNAYVLKHKNWKAFHLTNDFKSKLRGKARALSFIASQAVGDFLLFTDADIRLPTNWLKGILEPFEINPNIGVTVGITRMEDNDFFSKMQSMEWLTVLGFARLMSNLKIATTGMGNNMAVSKQAYEALGGYESIGFSIVEDYALYKAVIAKGFGFEQVLSKEVEAFTLPPDDFLSQRNRWISGAVSSKSKFAIPAFLQSFALPTYLLLIFLGYWKLAFGTWLTICFVTLVGLFLLERKTGIRTWYELSLFFGLYVPVAWFVQIIYYFKNREKVIWKDRTYKN